MLKNRVMALAMAIVFVCCFGGRLAFGGIGDALSGGVSYQGSLMENGVAADGVYDFRFGVYSSSGVLLSPLIDVDGVVVSGGLFGVELDFGDDLWNFYRGLDKWVEVSVRASGGGVYSALSPRTRLGGVAHAEVSRRLLFPYSESLSVVGGGVMMNLRETSGAVVARFSSSVDGTESIVRVDGATPSGFVPMDFVPAMIVDSVGSNGGVVALGGNYSIVGVSTSSGSGDHASVLGIVNQSANPEIVGVLALNEAADTGAALATGSYAGDFDGDVVVRGDAYKEFVGGMMPITPIAMGYVYADGSLGANSGNISVVPIPKFFGYTVHIDGYSFPTGSYIAQVTAVSLSIGITATVQPLDGDLIVTLWDTNTQNLFANADFQIVIYALPEPPIAREGAGKVHKEGATSSSFDSYGHGVRFEAAE